METGSSSDAEFARCVHAYMCGWDRMRKRAAVRKTTGVSSTTVASRLSTAVVTAATAKTWTSSRRGRPRDRLAIHAPQARNRPSSSHNCAITSTAARKPITGPSRRASARASWSGIAPVAMTRAAAGTAATASGQPARPDHRPGQHGEQRDDRQRLGGGGAQFSPLAAARGWQHLIRAETSSPAARGAAARRRGPAPPPRHRTARRITARSAAQVPAPCCSARRSSVLEIVMRIRSEYRFWLYRKSQWDYPTVLGSHIVTTGTPACTGLLPWGLPQIGGP